MDELRISGPEPYDEISPEEDARITAMVEEADHEIEERQRTGNWERDEDAIPVEKGAGARAPDEAKVTMRWSRAQLDVVRKAADLFGMPYQTYVKQAAFRAALDDLQKLQATMGKSKDEAA